MDDVALSVTAEAGAAEARRIFELQHAASRRGPTLDLAARRDSLARLRRLVTDNEKPIAEAISADFGNRSRAETELLEVVPTINAIRHAAKNLGRWMRPERRHVDLAFQPAKAWVRREPLGVVGVISPWNYPLLLAIAPLVDALAAGNRVMLKPSELTPNFSELLKRLISEAFDAALVAVVTGGVEVGQVFASLPFDHLLFTGSTAVGRKVMQAAAPNLTPVTLELGGKSPAVVAPDYPLEKAARSIAFGKFVNAGQTCIAPDYALVPREKARAFAEALIAQARKSYPKIAGNDDYSAMISRRHFERMVSAIEEARAGGASVLVHEDEGARGEGKIGPTVVLDAPDGGLLMNEEIFGPVLPVVGYDRLEDALTFIAARERPLALYLFSNDEPSRRRVLEGATSGGVTLNGTLLHIAQDDLPFGGVGPSGMGAYHGREGFKRLSHARAVHQVGAVNVFEKLGPPWGAFAATVARTLIRRS